MAFAQTPGFDATSTYLVSDGEIKSGDIVFYSEKGLVRASEPYSNHIFGVLTEKPLMVFTTTSTDEKPVVRSGIAQVNVTNEGGEIKPGDFITSSNTKGTGQKATISGYVLGTALAEMSAKEGQIPIAIRIEYAELTNTKSVLRLLDAFNIAAFQSTKDIDKASQFIKYLSSGLIVLGSLVVSFFLFARSIIKSIEAIGRNPLAKTAILMSIVIQAGLTILTILIGVGAAYLILRL